ncbi:MAG: DUF3300 domain-containing protein, partial [Blastocatellia bacterium]
ARPVSQWASSADMAPKIPADQLDSLVAPIALYPDPLLSQTLVASTYPLEIMQLQQWLSRHEDLNDQALVDAVSKQPWDPSIQGMAALPDVVKRLADDIQWTTDLGNAFLAQQADVMDAVQRMRQKAQDTGALRANQQQNVETTVVENKTVIVVEQADPQVVYVPSYDPTVAYGDPVYPYPPIYYPTGAAVAASAISFGVGVAMGAAWHGGWGYNAGWGTNNVNVNVNNNFNRNTNINGGNRTNVSGNNWQHNPQHRGGTPYSTAATANRYGAGAGGAGARPGAGAGTAGLGAGGAGARPAAGAGAAGAAARPFAGAGAAGAGADRVGSRSMPSSSGGGGRSAWGGGSSGASERAASSRGASSMGASRGGGGARFGGGGRRR